MRGGPLPEIWICCDRRICSAFPRLSEEDARAAIAFAAASAQKNLPLAETPVKR
jgi:hypothetical protein